jgi:hypothetical protein
MTLLSLQTTKEDINPIYKDVTRQTQTPDLESKVIGASESKKQLRKPKIDGATVA